MTFLSVVLHCEGTQLLLQPRQRRPGTQPPGSFLRDSGGAQGDVSRCSLLVALGKCPRCHPEEPSAHTVPAASPPTAPDPRESRRAGARGCAVRPLGRPQPRGLPSAVWSTDLVTN